MKTFIILTMHGAPPNDFPKRELGEYFSLHMQAENSPQRMDDDQRARYADLDRRVRAWPRTAVNDPFHASSQAMAGRLEVETGLTTLACFNEFCDPGLPDAVHTAVEGGAGRIVVITPMMTGGGEHAEIDIPEEIERLREKFPQVEIIYAWPFEPDAVTKLLSNQVQGYL